MDNFQIWRLIIILGFVCLSAVVAVQARRRGYSFGVWLIAGALGSPFLTMIVLGLLPDRSMQKRREQFAATLQKELQSVRAGESDSAIEQSLFVSIGDNQTLDPEAIGKLRPSIADRETNGELSIGDAHPQVSERDTDSSCGDAQTEV